MPSVHGRSLSTQTGTRRVGSCTISRSFRGMTPCDDTQEAFSAQEPGSTAEWESSD